MAEIEKKTLAEANAALKKERFEFVFSINGNIVCQRYFRIFGFREASFNSMELVDTIKNIAGIINDDLEAKTQTYLDLTAPQIFEDESEMNEWLENHGHELRTPTFIALRKSDATFIWNGEKVKSYDKPFNKQEYIGGAEEIPSYFTFTLYDNGWDLDKHKEVITYRWDASVYPRFVRFNVDLSNSKNPFMDEEKNVFMPFEGALIDAMNKGHRDLVPQIVHEFYECCARDKEEDTNYTNVVDYGNPKGYARKYSLNLYKRNLQYENSYQDYFQKKTKEYFGRKN